MSNTITGIAAGPHHGLKTTITAANNSVGQGSVLSVANGSIGSTSYNGFTFTNPSNNIKAGTITIKGEGNEEAEFDAAFINDLKLFLEVINDLPDEHPLGDLKHDMRMRRAFKRLGG